MHRTSVLIADDHLMFAQGVAGLLKADFDLVGLVGDGRELLEAARRLRPDVIVADITMPELSGLDALRQLRAEGNNTPVLLLTAHVNATIAAEAIAAGASGYMLKLSAGDALIAAIHEVLNGHLYLSPLLARDILTASAGGTGPAAKLTPRQRDVLRLIVQGLTMKQVASSLQISRRTVETHKYEMMQTLGLDTTAELIRYGIRGGLDAS